MNDKIKELKDLLYELDSKHNVSVPNTQQNINDVAKKIVRLFTTPVVIGTLRCDCGETKDVREIPICACCYNPHTGEW